jgi:wobble nucleotide-excising tRNase
MIESIQIQNEASYGSPCETLSGLLKFNFIYGSNGSGKTTISRIIADESIFSDCRLVWRGGISLECLVYNRDFVEKNFNPSSKLKGIFTLGEKDIDVLRKIDEAKNKLNLLKDDGLNLKRTLEGEDEKGGKKADLKILEDEFEEQCWRIKLKHDEKLQGAFVGVRGKKAAFNVKLLAEATNNSAELKNLDELENRADTVFGETPLVEAIIPLPNYESLLSLESDSILKKKVIGKEDVDIAAMIQKLSNSDWVKQGKVFYEVNNNVCPFCQKPIESSFSDSLIDYFDEAFDKDEAAIKLLLTYYKTKSEGLQKSLKVIVETPSKFLDTEKLKVEKELLDSKIGYNLQQIEKKQASSSQIIELDSLKYLLDEIKNLIDSANKSIKEHNKTVSISDFLGKNSLAVTALTPTKSDNIH